MSLEKGSPDIAHEYLNQLEALSKVESNKAIDQKYRLSHALCLKTGTGEASTLSFKVLHNSLSKYVTVQNLLRALTIESVIDLEVTADAILNLCELLLVELRMFGNQAILLDINQFVDRLLQVAQKEQMFALITKTYLLKSKLLLLEGDLPQARDLLDQAHYVAQAREFDRLTLVIINEQQRLEGTTSEWLDESTSLFDRLEKVQLESLLVSFRQNRVESYTGEMITSPSMDELKSFTQQLSQRKFDW